MEKERTGLLELLFIACLRPSRYKELVSRSRRFKVGYLCAVALVIVFLETVIPFAAWDASVGGLTNLFLNRFPPFVIEKGQLDCDVPLSFKVSDSLHIKEDASVQAYTEDDLKDEAYAMYFSKTNLVLKNGQVAQAFPYTEMGEGKVDNGVLASTVPYLRVLIGFFVLTRYLVVLIEYILIMCFYGVLCRRIARDKDGKGMGFKGTFGVALFARSFFAVLQALNHSLGNPVNETIALMIAAFLTISYIARAQIAIMGIELPGK